MLKEEICKVKAKKRNSFFNGFTLVELLVGITIFSLLIFLSTFSFRFFFDYLKREYNVFPKNAIEYYRIKRLINNTFYLVITDKHSNMYSNKKFKLFFYGDPRKLSFISYDKNTENLSVCEVYFKNSSLILSTSPLYSKDNDYNNPKITDAKREVLVRNLKNIHIYYMLNNNNIVDSLRNNVPKAIKLMLIEKNKKKEWFFKISPDFYNKKYLTEYLYNK